MKLRDFYNYRIKNSNLKTKNNKRQIIDEIRDNKDNAIFLRDDLDTNIIECCFLAMKEQENGLNNVVT